MIGLAVAVAAVPTDLYTFGIFLELSEVFHKLLILPLFRCFAMPSTLDTGIGTHADGLGKLLDHLFKVLYGVFLTGFYPDIHVLKDPFIDLFDEVSQIPVYLIPTLQAGLLPHPCVFVCIGLDLGPINIELVQIHAFLFKQVLIDVTEQFPRFVTDILAQKIAYRHMRRRFFPVK